jgi:hypothetical protein
MVPIDTPSSDLFSPNRPHHPHFHHLPVGYSNFKSINGLNHSLAQSPHDLIVAGNDLTDIPEVCLITIQSIS